MYFQCQHSSCQASDENEVTSEESLSRFFILEDVHADARSYRLLTEFAFLLFVAEEARKGRMWLFAFSEQSNNKRVLKVVGALSCTFPGMSACTILYPVGIVPRSSRLFQMSKILRLAIVHLEIMQYV